MMFTRRITNPEHHTEHLNKFRSKCRLLKCKMMCHIFIYLFIYLFICASNQWAAIIDILVFSKVNHLKSILMQVILKNSVSILHVISTSPLQ